MPSPAPRLKFCQLSYPGQGQLWPGPGGGCGTIPRSAVSPRRRRRSVRPPGGRSGGRCAGRAAVSATLGFPSGPETGSRFGFGMREIRWPPPGNTRTRHLSPRFPCLPLRPYCRAPPRLRHGHRVFRHVNDATRRVLEANGFRVVDIDGPAPAPPRTTCGRPRAGAESLARQNLRAFGHRGPTSSRGEQRRVRNSTPPPRSLARHPSLTLRRAGARRH